MHKPWKRLVAVALLPLLPLALSDCAKNPVTGKRQLTLISESQEIAIGKESHPQVLAEYGRVDIEDLQSYVDRVGQSMARHSERPDLPWHFTVVDTPVVNAFAVPGGYIYITRDILAYMNNEAEMAGVLGHEIGHVTARHSVSQITKSQLIGLGLGLGGAFSRTFRGLSDFAELGAGLLFLKYGRDAERQADELGVRYMFEQGYDPLQVSHFFTVFESMREQSGEALPNWLSSHPAPPDRIEATRRQARELLSGSDRQLQINRDDHLRHLERLVFGDNPREGFTDNGKFLHPELRFQIEYPNGWRVENTRGSVQFVQPNGEAVAQLTLAPKESTPEGRARELGAQTGVEMANARAAKINGKPAFQADYRVVDPASGSQIRATAAFISHGGNLYQIIGMAPPQLFQRHAVSLSRVLESFAELHDQRHLAVQPDRVEIYQVQRGGTLEDVARLYPNPRVPLRTLSELNRIDPAQPLTPGQLVKVVKAGRR